MKYVIANLKMNLVTAKECDQYLDALNQAWSKQTHNDGVKLIICPSPFFIERFAKRLPRNVLLGSQDVSWESRGSFTGEVSPVSLQDASVCAVICGHSERRGYFNETNEQVSRKVEAVLAHKMMAIICVGETVKEREHDDMTMIIAEQVTVAMSSVQETMLDRIIIAYEPRWAIGTGATPTTQDIMQMRIVIQKILIKKYGAETASHVAILYGGSVTAALMDEVCINADMQGVLVGRASLKPIELMKMSNELCK